MTRHPAKHPSRYDFLFLGHFRKYGRAQPCETGAALLFLSDQTSIEAQDSHALVVEIERARLNMAETTPMLEVLILLGNCS